MKKLILFVAVVAISLSSAIAQTETDAIKEVIMKGYVHGAFNELNPDEMRKTFHEDFAIFSPKGNDISKYPIKQWASGVAERKAESDFDPEKNKWDHKFDYVDVTGKSAQVKLELHREGKHIFTDYLSLLKFDDGWRVVAKVYYRHN